MTQAKDSSARVTISAVAQGIPLQIVVGAPVCRRERDAPEIGRRGIEFQGDVVTLGHLSRRTADFAGDTLFGHGMLEDQPGLDRKGAIHEHERAVVVDTQSGHFKRRLFALQGHVNACADTQQDALAAAAFFTRPKLVFDSAGGLRHRRSRFRRDQRGSDLCY